MNSISFYGAVSEVTGSRIVVSSWKDQVMLDCGQFQGHRDESYLKNKAFFDNDNITDYVILSHSHLDHAGMLPALYKQGYNGKVFCTPPTKDLANYMLPDAVKVMEKDLPIVAKMIARHGGKQSNVDMLFDASDVSGILSKFVDVPYLQETKLTDELSFKLIDNCHILGSASVKLTVDQKGTKHKVWYTSDLGHDHSILSRNPVIPQDITHLIIETTYGNKDRSTIDPVQQILDSVVQTYRRGGKSIIPAFSVHRMQTIILILHKLYRENAMPDIPIYIDSPLGNKVTGLYSKYKDELNEETIKYFTDQGFDPFNFPNLKYVTEMEMTTAVSKSDEPCIIVSASGMCEGGRVVEYLKDNISNPLNHVLLVGYTARGTLGRRLLDGRHKEVTINGLKVSNKCQTSYIEGFSAHADIEYILDYIDKASENSNIKNIFLIHGEEDSVKNVKRRLNDKGYNNIVIPVKGKSYKLSQQH